MMWAINIVDTCASVDASGFLFACTAEGCEDICSCSFAHKFLTQYSEDAKSASLSLRLG